MFSIDNKRMPTTEEQKKKNAERSARWRAADPERHAKKNRADKKRWRKNNPEKNRQRCRDAKLRKKYGLSPEQHAAMTEAQAGICLICCNERKLFIDHCHATGKVRGLICHNCNSVLGHAGDSAEVLTNAVKYLTNK